MDNEAIMKHGLQAKVYVSSTSIEIVIVITFFLYLFFLFILTVKRLLDVIAFVRQTINTQEREADTRYLEPRNRTNYIIFKFLRKCIEIK